jgi:CRP-like cAMP-binding protein
MLSQDQNLLLSGLSQESQYLLASHSVAVSLPLQTVLYEANIAPRFAYFLRSGIASVVASMTDGETAEVGMIGHEGVVGAIPLLGSSSVPTNCFIQLEATALRIPMPAFQATFRSSEEIRQRSDRVEHVGLYARVFSRDDRGTADHRDGYSGKPAEKRSD